MTNSSEGKKVEGLDEVARLLATQIRLTLGNQRQAIIELDRAGLGQARIATLLGTSPGTVKTELRDAKRRAQTKSPKSAKTT